MKMKKRFGFVMIMAAMVVAAYDDVQVVYRGQLKANGQAPAAQTMPMTFRLYAKKNSGTASWTTNGVVAIDDKGLFQVALRGEGLAEAIDSGKANWIGISIAGGKEHYPRQALLASPAAEKAVSAGSLADAPSVARLRDKVFNTLDRHVLVEVFKLVELQHVFYVVDDSLFLLHFLNTSSIVHRVHTVNKKVNSC